MAASIDTIPVDPDRLLYLQPERNMILAKTFGKMSGKNSSPNFSNI
jgi:hypothetical protein